MKNVSLISAADDITSYEQVVRGLYRPRKTSALNEKARVEVALTNYADSIRDGTVTPLGLVGVVRDHHYSIYDSDSESVVSLKKELNDGYFGHSCPYCQVDTVSHIDHYLPRAHFPEFSASRQNLLMSCDICNSKYKLEEWGNGPDQRVIHPRFNILGANIYLQAFVSYESQAIVASFSVRSGLPLSGLVERHFRLMRLNTRYIAKVTFEEVPKMRNILLAEPTVALREARLLAFVQDQIVAQDLNSWLRAFYQGMQGVVGDTAAGGL